MGPSSSIIHACYHWAYEPYLTHVVIALLDHDRSGTFAGRAVSQLEIGPSRPKFWFCLDAVQTKLWSTTEWKHTIMEQTIVARLYYPPGECQRERNEPLADTHHMRSNNLTQNRSLSHTQTRLYTICIYQTIIWEAGWSPELPAGAVTVATARQGEINSAKLLHISF